MKGDYQIAVRVRNIDLKMIKSPAIKMVGDFVWDEESRG
jgi:hypothetical protein